MAGDWVLSQVSDMLCIVVAQLFRREFQAKRDSVLASFFGAFLKDLKFLLNYLDSPLFIENRKNPAASSL